MRAFAAILVLLLAMPVAFAEPPADLPRLTVEPAPPKVVQKEEPKPEKSKSIWSSPILWIAIGVAAIGGVAALGIAISGERDPYGGSSNVVLGGQ